MLAEVLAVGGGGKKIGLGVTLSFITSCRPFFPTHDDFRHTQSVKFKLVWSFLLLGSSYVFLMGINAEVSPCSLGVTSC